MLRSIIMFFTALATVFVPILVVTWLLALPIRTYYGGIILVSPKRLVFAILVPLFFAIKELFKKSLSLSGIIAAFLVGFALTISNLSFISMLLIFFYSSSKLTKFRADRKAKQDAESKTTTRTWLNVMNNGGVPTALALLYMVEAGCTETKIDFNGSLFTSSWLSVAVLGSISCACGDTWASELGSAVGKPTAKLITTGKNVPAGTNGGVTLLGTIASATAGGIIGLTFVVTNYFLTDASSVNWLLIVIGLISGLCGSMMDSFLGATMQYSGFDEISKKVVSYPGSDIKHISGINLLSNHMINFISCFISAIISPFLYQLFLSFSNNS